MKKVFIIHGFEGSPNGGWRPWLMEELEKLDIYACALPMPTPESPICSEWVEEISRQINSNKNDDIYLVGHSLGSTAILRYLESAEKEIMGVILVSGPCRKNNNRKIDSFLDKPFNYGNIKSKSKKFAIIQGDNDPNVPMDDAETLSRELEGKLIIVPDGGHLNGSSGWHKLPQCFDELNEMMNQTMESRPI
ncbi:alpha/beta hydrolase [Patescibacteria group bacterium]|nr:alpha/beta hydrolase [Patescibacteria group bacterium]